MPTEKAKMLRGAMYRANDPQLSAERLLARQRLHAFNHSAPESQDLRQSILSELFGKLGKDVVVEPTFRCDYGYNIHLDDRVFINFGCVMIDVCEIFIGEDTLLGPGVHVYTAGHPLDWRERKNMGVEFGRPIRIGNDCWIGGGAILCPGVTIGDRSVIGAGSVVTRDVPEDVLAVGNPCRVLKSLK